MAGDRRRLSTSHPSYNARGDLRWRENDAKSNSLYRFLIGTLDDYHVVFLPREPIPRNVAYIPQRHNDVLHWKLKDLLPRNSAYLDKLLNERVPTNRYLSAFSGGQIARILVASALHRLEAANTELNYLLLDEAFEGISLDLLATSLNGVAETWNSKNSSRFLRALLVTHLDVEQMAPKLSHRIALNRVSLVLHPSEIHADYEKIPVTINIIRGSS